jgi:hypothetical protein
MTGSVNYNLKDSNSKDRDVIRYIPFDLTLKYVIAEQIQTQDVFHIGFYPENNHLDIDVYEFLDYKDIYYEIKVMLCSLNLNPWIKYQILSNIIKNADRINANIVYFGGAHVFD